MLRIRKVSLANVTLSPAYSPSSNAACFPDSVAAKFSEAENTSEISQFATRLPAMPTLEWVRGKGSEKLFPIPLSCFPRFSSVGCGRCLEIQRLHHHIRRDGM